LALGIYPEVSLKEAREKRANAGKMLDKGLNPSAYKKLTSGIASLEGGDSCKAVADEWLAKIEAEGRATATMEKLRWLLSFAEPLIGTYPIAKLTAPDFLTVLRTVEVRAALRRLGYDKTEMTGHGFRALARRPATRANTASRLRNWTGSGAASMCCAGSSKSSNAPPELPEG
jgi:hypothetical protein